jgi:hypothetical protein
MTYVSPAYDKNHLSPQTISTFLVKKEKNALGRKGIRRIRKIIVL